MDLAFAAAVSVLVYVYAGYPLVLRILVWLRQPRGVRWSDETPPLTLLISAHNEERVLEQKLLNALALDYPADRLEIVVVSDASTDETDAIVRRMQHRGVRLLRKEPRRGKTAGLNDAVPLVSGEILVFSDANALYAPDALRKLVRNFGDPAVGCVTGESRYVSASSGAASVGEKTYWGYEARVKRLESALGSVVGGDGAIYAIRRHLWRRLPETAINDFLNPLQIVVAGWRAIYEPEAVCYEAVAGNLGREYARRVRIVSRSWRAIFQVPQVLNPWRVGLFSLQVVSHKVLRWLSGLFLAVALVSGAVGLLPSLPPVAGGVWPAAALGGLALLAWRPARRVAGLAAYVALIHVASLVGVMNGTFNRVSGIWTPPRTEARFDAGRPSYWLPLVAAVPALVLALALLMGGPSFAARVTFWGALSCLVYVYAGYPVLIAGVARFAGRPCLRRAIEPTVSVLITANDERSVIREKLQNTLAIDYPARALQIVVASDGSVDGTDAIVEEHADRGVRLFAYPTRRGKMAAINATLPRLRSDVVVFSDANVFVEPTAIRQLVASLADPSVGAVSADVVLVGDRAALGPFEDSYVRYERWLQQSESRVGSMIGVDGALFAVRRHLFVAPPDDTILDDVAIPMSVLRQGYRVVFEPGARAYEHGVLSARDEFRRRARIVAGAVQFLARGDSRVPWSRPQAALSLVSHKLLRWLTPICSLATFVSAVILASVSTVYAIAAIAQALVLVAGAGGVVQPLRRLWPIGPAYYFCLVQTATLLGILRGLSGRQAAAWQRFSRKPVELAR